MYQHSSDALLRIRDASAATTTGFYGTEKNAHFAPVRHLESPKVFSLVGVPGRTRRDRSPGGVIVFITAAI